jgi:hypothetical protein
MFLRLSLCVACAFLAAGCADNPAPGQPGGAPTNPGNQPPPKVQADPPEWELYAAVVSHVAPRVKDNVKGATVVLVALPEGNATEKFCGRFKDQAIPVRPFPRDGKFDPKGAYLIQIQDISGEKYQKQGADGARVFLRAFPADEPQKCGTPYPVVLRRIDGRWKVAEK